MCVVNSIVVVTHAQPDTVLLKTVGMWICVGHVDQSWVPELIEHVVTELEYS